MLEYLNPDGINALRRKTIGLTPFSQLGVSKLRQGAIVRALTESGNCYLFEVTDSVQQHAHVVRCESRPKALGTGYRGIRRIQGEFAVGQTIVHDRSVTSRVTKLDLVDVHGL